MQTSQQKLKPEFRINLSKGAAANLTALPFLGAIDPDKGYHTSQNLRRPLGIYNTSISRICEKVIKCCQKLEQYFKASTHIDALRAEREIRQEIIDYIELSLYAAAEHVDDIRLITKGFFLDVDKYKSSKPAITLEQQIKKHKSLISASANAIKHNQARIRLYSLEFTHVGIESCLHGYFVEGVSNGAVGPSKIFHEDNSQVFSVTSLMWEIIVFLLHSSKSLSTFLAEINPELSDGHPVECEIFSKSVIAAARLPLYSFDENHPFSETRLIVSGDDESQLALNSNIYGSIRRKWSHSGDGHFGNDIGEYEGDGATKQFILVHPMALNLQHWD